MTFDVAFFKRGDTVLDVFYPIGYVLAVFSGGADLEGAAAALREARFSADEVASHRMRTQLTSFARSPSTARRAIARIGMMSAEQESAEPHLLRAPPMTHLRPCTRSSGPSHPW